MTNKSAVQPIINSPRRSIFAVSAIGLVGVAAAAAMIKFIDTPSVQTQAIGDCLSRQFTDAGLSIMRNDTNRFQSSVSAGLPEGGTLRLAAVDGVYQTAVEFQRVIGGDDRPFATASLQRADRIAAAVAHNCLPQAAP